MPDTYFNIQHDWQKDVVFKKKWKTSILTGSTGKEQRSALYTWPRRSVSGSLHQMSYQESAQIKRKIYKYLHSTWGAPLWQDVAYLTAGANAGQATINVNTADYTNFIPLSFCILFNEDNDYEIIKISSLTDTIITAATNLVDTWPAGTQIYPVINARITGQQKHKSSTNQTGTLNIEADETFEIDNPAPAYSEQTPTFSQYLEKYVFNIKPNWAREPSQIVNHATDFLQFLGLGYAETKTDEPVMRFDFDYFCVNRQKINEIITFFDSCQGRLQSFWIPTWQDDILIIAPISINDTSITIENIEYTDFWLNNEMFGRYLYFQMPGGNISIKKIVSAPSSTVITLDEGMEYACTQDQLSGLSVSFLALARFSLDEIKVNYSTSHSGHITLGFQTVRDI